MGKTVVITGANRGLGLELVKQLSENEKYSKIYALCRNTSDGLTSLAASSNDKIVVCDNVDVMEEDSEKVVQDLFKSMQEGGDAIPVHLVIHNAGAFGPPIPNATPQDVFASQTLDNITRDTMVWAFNLNTMAPLFITRALMPNIKAGITEGEDPASPDDVRKIIIISSLVGSIADNTSGGSYAYRVAKTGVNMVGKCLAEDLKKTKQIAVGLVHPGMVATGFALGEGGPRFPGQRDVDESARGVFQAIDAVTMENTGCFLHGNYGEGIKPINW